MGGGEGWSLTPLRINELTSLWLEKPTGANPGFVEPETQFGDPVNESEHTITSSRLGLGLQGARASKGPEA